MNKLIIFSAPSGSGKSTIAREIARRLGFYYLNTGSFYRAYTLSALDRGIDPEDRDRVYANAKSVTITVEDGLICLDGICVEDRLHTPEVDAWCSQVSADPRIRAMVNDSVRELAHGMDIITEGRDTTTVIFPDADLKFYFDADPEVRAQRRAKDQPGMAKEAILSAILERDRMDKEKESGALKVADGAIVLDTTLLTINQVCEKVIQAVKSTR